MSSGVQGRTSKEALARYPIAYGAYVSSPPHGVSTFDLSVSVDRFLELVPRPAALLYVDPPWGPALASGFRTKAGVEGKADFPALMETLARVIGEVRAPFVVEMGNTWASQVAGALQRGGAPFPITLVRGRYYKTKPMVYIVGMPPQYQREVVDSLEDVDDELAPGFVMDAMRLTPGSVVVDPMCGRGLTAEHALERGLVFAGNELAPFRAAATLQILREFPNHPKGAH